MRERLRAAGVTSAADLETLGDLSKLPFSHKADLREHYPFGLFAVPRTEVVRIHASSGTRGKPTVVGYTRNDLAVWSEVMARTLALAGVEPGMVLHNAYGYGLFTGGLGVHMGAELLGCTVVPMSGGFTQRQVLMLEDLGAEVLCATPSYTLNIAQALAEQGVGLERLKLKIAHLRRRAVDGRDAPGDRSAARRDRGQRLRTVRDRRPRRVVRMRRGTQWGTRAGGSLSRRSDRPGVSSSLCPMASKASWCSPR